MSGPQHCADPGKGEPTKTNARAPRRVSFPPAVAGILALQGAAGNRAATGYIQRAIGSAAGVSDGRLRAPLPMGSPASSAVSIITGRLPTPPHRPGHLAVQREPGKLEEFQNELTRRFVDRNDPGLLARRAALVAQAAVLTDLDSYTLVYSLLQPTSKNIFADRFQGLAKSTRFQVLTKLFGRMHLGAEYLLKPLAAKGGDYPARFRELVPDSRQRQQLLTILSNQITTAHRAGPNALWVHLEFRNEGGYSPDNGADKDRTTQLGEQPDSGKNAMEIRGDVVGHAQGTVYDIRRTLEGKAWQRVGGQWRLTSHDPAWTDDDSHDADEDLDPLPYFHIYSVDSPGFPPDAIFHPDATDAVYKANFVENVYAKVGSRDWELVSDEIHWHSVSTMQKVNGRWERNKSKQTIDPTTGKKNDPLNVIADGHGDLDP